MPIRWQGIGSQLDRAEPLWLSEATVPASSPNGLRAAEELKIIRREVEQLRMERDILKRRPPSSPTSPDEISFHPGREAHYPLEVLCGVMAVARNGFYAWCHRPANRRAQQNQILPRAKSLGHY